MVTILSSFGSYRFASQCEWEAVDEVVGGTAERLFDQLQTRSCVELAPCLVAAPSARRPRECPVDCVLCGRTIAAAVTHGTPPFLVWLSLSGSPASGGWRGVSQSS